MSTLGLALLAVLNAWGVIAGACGHACASAAVTRQRPGCTRFHLAIVITARLLRPSHGQQTQHTGGFNTFGTDPFG